jgi:hypothetical protein
MKRFMVVTLLFLAVAGFAAAQRTKPPADILGAHLNYGRGCTACHTPHSGASGNGKTNAGESTPGSQILWGEDVTSLYGKTITTGGGNYVEVLPTSMSATTPDVNGMLTCLSCHDGNYAMGAMMKNKVYESLPATYRTNAISTLLGSDGASAGNYLNDHPVGLSAKVSCGGARDWDCTVSGAGVVQMTGPHSSQFVKNYGYFVSLGVYSNNPVVVCTTCHNQHVMSVVKVSDSSVSGLPAGTYTTMFFLRAPYNPNDPNPQSNQTAQFCRQCHGDKSNEMNGGTAGTVF